MFANVHRLWISLLILPGLFLSSNQSLGKHTENDIRFDVPADGRVHVQNRFGDVFAEVWTQPYVSVSAAVSGSSSPAPTRSPIVIDNRGKFLSISAFRSPANASTII